MRMYPLTSKLINKGVYIVSYLINHVIRVIVGIRIDTLGKNANFEGLPRIKPFKTSNIKIGNDFAVEQGVKLEVLFSEKNARLAIGNNVFIGRNSTVIARKMISIGNNVKIAANTFIIDHDHNYAEKSQLETEPGFVAESIEIEDDVWIGTGAIILKGVNIGSGAVVGAGSVVVKNVPKHTLVAGVPAQVIKNIGENKQQV